MMASAISPVALPNIPSNAGEADDKSTVVECRVDSKADLDKRIRTSGNSSVKTIKIFCSKTSSVFGTVQINLGTLGSGIVDAGFDMKIGSKLRHPSSLTPCDCHNNAVSYTEFKPHFQHFERTQRQLEDLSCRLMTLRYPNLERRRRC
jgi:hypothetical protein